MKKRTRLKWSGEKKSFIRQIVLLLFLTPLFASGKGLPEKDKSTDKHTFKISSEADEHVKFPMQREQENMRVLEQREPPLETLFWVLCFTLAIMVLYLLRRVECRSIRQNRQRAPPGSYRIR